VSALLEKAAQRPKSTLKRQRKARRATSLFAHGEPLVWLTGGALALSLSMIVGLLGLVVYQGGSTFWPIDVVRVERTSAGPLMGEVAVDETYRPEAGAFSVLAPDAVARTRAEIDARGGVERRRMLRTGNYDLTGTHFHWASDFEIKSETRPDWALVVERTSWGRFYGVPCAFLVDGETRSSDPAEIWKLYEEQHGPARDRFSKRYRLEQHEMARENRTLDDARLALRAVELAHGKSSPEFAAAEREFTATQSSLQERFVAIGSEIQSLNAENARFKMELEAADGARVKLEVAEIVRAYPANQLTWSQKVGVYFSRWGEFLTDVPREANSEGGVFPAIFGTVVMTLVMSILVVPFGVLAALYLREYAKPGLLVSTVRIAVNNLAGVPSIVFGVFGLGFFCYILGSSIDGLVFAERLPNPTFGKGGLLWAALTLALLTLPVVIVATEEALAAVPGSMREGSYACGATKWQTIQRIVLPRALPGIMTGMILAIARGAGEVAPLMLVGAVKLAHDLALATQLPFLHPERSFMHLGFHIYDLGFQSQNSEAAKPMVYTTTLLLIGIIVVLNVAAIGVRTRLRRRFLANQF
jgi:phosphate transport system permease protein